MAGLVGIKDVRAAAHRIMGLAHRTPVFRSTNLDRAVNAQVYLKAECLQKTGSFKIRGALNAVLTLTEDEAAHGVVTHSSGNHGQALAAAAAVRGVPVTVVAPKNTAKAKLDAMRDYGAKVVLCEPTQEARVGGMEEEAARMGGARIVPPYNDPVVIAGQGSLGLEFLKQVPDLDAIIVPTSGGGMLSGICVAASSFNHRPRVIAAEPAGKRLGEALAARQRVLDPRTANQPLDTIVDAMPTQCLGPLCWEHALALGDRTVFTVTDRQVVEAMAFVFSRVKLVIEPAAATGVAALLDGQHLRGADPISASQTESATAAEARLPKIGVILCGGNVDLGTLGRRFSLMDPE
mmetsp:Transcript_61736/g.194685  ORF Transcript_61736/g.194685 Transcript_61736/m.194685 type:complete len:349 (+) Transcript_61736:65-1111(+)